MTVRTPDVHFRRIARMSPSRVRCRIPEYTLLHQRQNLRPELLHAAEDFLDCRTAETEIEAADTDVAQRPDVAGDERRRTREQPVFAIAGLRRRGLAEHGHAQGQ